MLVGNGPESDAVMFEPTQVNPITMLTMIDFLASKPSFDGVARQLVVSIMGNHRPRAALISIFEHDGSLHSAGSFGLSESTVLASRKMSLWDSAPITDAVRRGEPLAFLSTEELKARYPWMEHQADLCLPTMVWPLTLRDQQLGAMLLLFSEAPEEEALSIDMSGVIPMLALYMSLMRSESGADSNDGQQSRSSGFAQGHTRGSSGGSHPANQQTSLSKRQEVILRLMSRGMTNSQIAHRVGFSESTVRQETIAIYRYLGADGRHQAVQIAEARGLLSSPVEQPVDEKSAAQNDARS